MNKTIVTISLFIAILGMMLAGCSNNTAPPTPLEEARDIYVSAMEASKESARKMLPYLYYDDPKYYGVLAESTQVLYEYEILDMQEINPKLFSFTNRIRDNYRGERVVYHFVGIINEEYRVMMSYRIIPEDLKENFCEENYTTNSDGMSPDNVIIIDP